MEVSLLNQYLGDQSIIERFKEIIESEEFTHLKMVIALVRPSGLNLIEGKVKEFIDKGSVFEGVFGLDIGTSREACQQLLTSFPISNFWIFGVRNSNILFHPKAVIFHNNESYIAIIGSFNLTKGGYQDNFEAGLEVRANKNNTEDTEFIESLEKLWNNYKNPESVIEGHKTIKLNADTLKNILKKERFRNVRIIDPITPLKVIFTKVKLEKRPRVTNSPKFSYLEIKMETGGGTQVQIPIRVVEEYFLTGPEGADITLILPNGEEVDTTIIYFSNSTQRIQMSFLSGLKRPLILKLEKVRTNIYKCEMAKRRTSEYRAWRERCVNSTRKGSKKWGIE